jgi:hypothetical protein
MNKNLGIWPAVKKNPLTFGHFNICTWQWPTAQHTLTAGQTREE